VHFERTFSIFNDAIDRAAVNMTRILRPSVKCMYLMYAHHAQEKL